MIKVYSDGFRISRWSFRLMRFPLRGLGLGVEWTPGPCANRFTFSMLSIRLLVVKLVIQHSATWRKQ